MPSGKSAIPPKTHTRRVTVAIVGTEDNLASVKTLTQRRLERLEGQKEGLQAFVDADAVTQRQAEARYEPARKPPRWMRDLLGEDQ